MDGEPAADFHPTVSVGEQPWVRRFIKAIRKADEATRQRFWDLMDDVLGKEPRP